MHIEPPDFLVYVLDSHYKTPPRDTVYKLSISHTIILIKIPDWRNPSIKVEGVVKITTYYPY